MSNDTLRDISQIGLVRRLGVPRIPVLRRYAVGEPALDGPVLVTAGPLADTVRKSLVEAELTEAGPEGPVAGIVADVSTARRISDLDGLRDVLAPAVRRLSPGGRVVVLAPSAGPKAAVEAVATAEAVAGIVRSLAKEVRAGATANLLVVRQGAGTAEALGSPLRFLLSSRSAFVSGQVIDVSRPVGPGAGAEPRIALVTGAARGIGESIAQTLAREGATVIAVDVPGSGESLIAVANRIGGTALHLDITADDAPSRLVEAVQARFGRLDVLVHNAGITRDKLFANMDADRWDSVLSVNLRAPLAITNAFADAGLLSGTARVVAVSSTSGIAGNRGQSNYAASKAGVIGAVHALAPRLASKGVTVNAVAPGFIETEMTARMPFATREAARRINSLKQGGLPVDVAETVAWLGQADSAGVTGQVVRVCGQSMVGA